MNQSSNQLKNHFIAKIEQFQEQAKKYKKNLNQIAGLRFIYFVITLVLLVYFVNTRSGLYATLVVLPFPFLFGYLVYRYNTINRKYQLTLTKAEYLTAEIERLDLRLSSLDKGEEFIDHSHPYASDLDLFGNYSIFSLINRSKLTYGRSTLANWLKSPASISSVQERREAVSELRVEDEFRLNWFAESYIDESKKDEKADFQGFSAKHLEPKPAVMFAAFFGIFQISALSICYLFNLIPGSVVGLSLLVNIGLMAAFLGPANKLFQEMGNLGYMLKSYRNIFKLAEEKDFKSSLLIKLKNTLTKPSAYNAVKEIENHLYWINSRNGMFYWILNTFFLIDLWLLSGIGKWAIRYNTIIPKWFTVVGELESLLSISAFQYANPSFNFATLTDEALVYQAKSLGHPLIPEKERVHNDFSLADSGTVLLLTGANMSGKTTFERTLGVNLVLAQMGAPCCCDQMHISLFQVFTSMRTQDKLEESTSSFYAELKRIKQLLDLLENKKHNKNIPVFYLLDEILKGTNSEDRNIGAESLIRQLINTHSMGLISTHDLSLASLEKEIDSFVNYSFNSQIEKDEVKFDYKLNEGPCHTFNAVPLMKKMGIEIVE